MAFELSADQTKAINAFSKWFKKGEGISFKLAGPAGSGKSTVAMEAIRSIGLDMSEVLVMAPTGKAAYVLYNKGHLSAGTIHSRIYIYAGEIDHEREKLSVELIQASEDQDLESIANIKSQIAAIDKLSDNSKGSLKFVLKPKELFSNYKLFLVDEGSMVNWDVKRDLEAMGVPILYLGDPFQLPPVNIKPTDKESVFFDGKGNPLAVDYELTDIHRQAQNSPILNIATKVRTKPSFRHEFGTLRGEGRDFVVKTTFSKLTADILKKASQIICGTNNTRHMLNELMRTDIYGFQNPLPVEGDKLICIKNSSKHALVNGAMGTVINTPDYSKLYSNIITVDILMDNGQVLERLPIISAYFSDPDEIKDRVSMLPKSYFENYASFEYGYAVTCHKCQGSQFESGIIIYEPLGNSTLLKRRWYYTALTRFESRVIIATM